MLYCYLNNIIKQKAIILLNALDRQRINKEIGKEQYLVPYLMSSHPGSTIKDAIELAVF